MRLGQDPQIEDLLGHAPEMSDLLGLELDVEDFLANTLYQPFIGGFSGDAIILRGETGSFTGDAELT